MTSKTNTEEIDPICAICLEKVNIECLLKRTVVSRPVAVLSCGHPYHLDCITNAFFSRQGIKCPCCRQRQPGDWIPLRQSYSLDQTDIPREEDEVNIVNYDQDLMVMTHISPLRTGSHSRQHIRFDATQEESDDSDDHESNDAFSSLLQGHLRCLYVIADERLECLRRNRVLEERKLTRANAEQWGNNAIRRICDTVGLLVEQESSVRNIMEWAIQYQTQLQRAESLVPHPSSESIEKVQQFLSEQIEATRHALTTLQRSQAVMCMPGRELSLGQRIGRLLSIQRELAVYGRT